MELKENHSAVKQRVLLPDLGHYWAWKGTTHIWERSTQIRALGCCSLSDLSNSFPVSECNLHDGDGESRVD